MVPRRAVTAAVLLLAGSAVAQTPLPPGLSQQGGVIMMEPVDSGAMSPAEAGPSQNGERHASLQHVLSAADHDLFTRAFDAADRGDWVGARALADQGHDPVARRLVTWRYLLDKNGGASFDDINAFLKANPDWPARDTLYARAEAVIDLNMSPAQVIVWFGARQPVSGMGQVRLGEALVATGKTALGREAIRAGWIDGAFDAGQELSIVQHDGAYITPETDRERLNTLLWRDDSGSARRELSRVANDVQRVAQTRLELRTSPAAGQRMAAALPGDLSADPDLLFDRARSARRGGDNAQAESLLLRALNGGAGRAHPGKLWVETNIIAREALKDQNYRIAYQILAATDFKSGDEFSESKFMAGWVALRFLKEPKTALAHFQKLEAGVSRPISLSRAHYWQGRAYEAQGDLANAYAQYQAAGKASNTFYGQIALARIEAAPVLHVASTVPEAGAARAEFDADGLSHAMRVLADLGQVNFLRIFALRYADAHPDAKHMAALCQAMVDLGFREVAVRAAKQASYNGILFLAYDYPVIPIPPLAGTAVAPEPAVTLSLIRQETEFDPTSVSGPGARGLMQIMPAGARHDSSLAGVAYRPNDLFDPAYSMQLGQAEFGAYMSDWGGSLIVASAAYNAGPNNAKKWLNNNGDPRSPASDPIDWIEQIPFNETRNYVMRVIENTQIYRNRLAGRDQPLRILNDLYAPNAPQPKPLEWRPPPPAAVPVPQPKPGAN